MIVPPVGCVLLGDFLIKKRYLLHYLICYSLMALDVIECSE
jgi:hypothetical protein